MGYQTKYAESKVLLLACDLQDYIHLKTSNRNKEYFRFHLKHFFPHITYFVGDLRKEDAQARTPLRIFNFSSCFSRTYRQKTFVPLFTSLTFLNRAKAKSPQLQHKAPTAPCAWLEKGLMLPGSCIAAAVSSSKRHSPDGLSGVCLPSRTEDVFQLRQNKSFLWIPLPGGSQLSEMPVNPSNLALSAKTTLNP